MQYKLAILVVWIFILALASPGNAGITLQKASALAQNKLGVATTPQSIPAIASVSDNTSYWIIELDDIWVPVTSDGKIPEERSDQVYNAIKLHYLAREIYSMQSSDSYITKKVNTFLLMQGNVQTKITFLETYHNQMPDELKPGVQKLIDKAKNLDSKLSTCIDNINSLANLEGEVMSTWIDPSKYQDWHSKFGESVQSVKDVINAAYAYDKEKASFLQVATNFTQRQNVSASDRQLVNSFISGVDISGIPTSLPPLQDLADSWERWYQTKFAPEAVKTSVDQYYEKYFEALAHKSVIALRAEAATRINAANTAFSDVDYAIGSCLDDLSHSERAHYKNAKEFLNKSTASYYKGEDYFKALDYESAEKSFQDALGWAEKASNEISALKDVSCPTQPGPKPNPLFDFLARNGIYIVGLLVLILVGLYIYNKHKSTPPKEEEEEYGYGEYYGYGSDEDYSKYV